MAETLTIRTATSTDVVKVVDAGPQGPAGANGTNGQGVPVGGITGQVLKKASNTNYDTEWGTGGGGSVTFGTTAGTACEGNDGRIATIKSASISTVNGSDGGIGGTININGWESYNGGSLLMNADGRGNGGSINTSDNGGNIDTYQDGGSINTSDGGGSIDTRGTGSIELGVAGTRTTLTGTATEDRAIALPDAAGTLALTSNITKSAVGLGNVTNNAQVTSVTGTAPIVSSGGTTPAISISAATTLAAGSMSAADKSKLDGVATGATANATDAQLRDRSTHTGSQAASTISDSTTAGRALLTAADASAQRTSLGLGTLATQSGTFSGTSSGTNTGDQTITLTGDVTGSGTGSFAATIANNAVTNAKLAQVATSTLKGRATAATGNVEDLTASQVRTILNVADGATANSSDATLLSRANHTGTQAVGTITGLGGAATLNVGTTAGTVAAGDHTHAQLHDRSHAITSTSDHTANNWKVWYSNASGQVTELSLGAANTVLTSNGASSAPTFTAPAAGGSKTYTRFTALDNQPTSSSFATLDTRNSIAVLDFDDAATESAVFVGVIPEGASLGSGLIVYLHFMATTATSGNVRWSVAFERSNTDLDADSFDTATAATVATSGTSGIVTVGSITCTTIDSVTAGDLFRVRIQRIGADAADTMTGDAELVAVEVRSAA